MHFQQAAHISKALVDAGVDFESMVTVLYFFIQCYKHVSLCNHLHLQYDFFLHFNVYLHMQRIAINSASSHSVYTVHWHALAKSHIVL